jgi:deazaflavin-dependent oxidoreductase (nitroreductase family)
MVHTRRTTSVQRPLLGLRGTPGRLALWAFRMPLRAYEHGRGHLLGHTFLRLVHVGRRTGREHSAVAMVLSYDPATQEAVVCSAWGPDADWILNLRAGPAVRVDIGRESFAPRHRFLTVDEAVQVGLAFRDRHPHRLRFMARVLGWGDLRTEPAIRAFVAAHPFVALRPA